MSLDRTWHGALLDKELEKFRILDLGTRFVGLKANGQDIVEACLDSPTTLQLGSHLKAFLLVRSPYDRTIELALKLSSIEVAYTRYSDSNQQFLTPSTRHFPLHRVSVEWLSGLKGVW